MSIRPKLEEMTTEELLAEWKRVHKGVEFKKVKQTEDGGILLDPHNPNDKEWYENDDAYDFY